MLHATRQGRVVTPFGELLARALIDHRPEFVDATGVRLWRVVIGEHQAADQLPERAARALAATWNAGLFGLREAGELTLAHLACSEPGCDYTTSTIDNGAAAHLARHTTPAHDRKPTPAERTPVR